MGRRKWILGVVLFALPTFWCGHFALFANDSVTIRVQHYPENAFLRIPEFFSGNEYSGDKLIIRTNSDREGLYFSIPLGKKNSLIRNAKSIELQFIESTNPIPRISTYYISEISAEKESLLLGVTGKDWNQSTMKLVAWKVLILDSANKQIFTSQSTLWGHQE